MARQRLQQLVTSLAALPWWTSLVAAAVAFAVLRYGMPVLAGAYPALAGAARIAPQFAALPATIFVVLAAIAFLGGRSRARSPVAPSLDAINKLSDDELVRQMCEGFVRCGFEPHRRPNAKSVDIVLRRGASMTVLRCRDWRTPRVSVKALRELHAAMLKEGASGALFVTIGGFSPEALQFADDKPIGLIGGEALLELVRPGRGAPGRVEPYLSGILGDLTESAQGTEPSHHLGTSARERALERAAM